MHSFCDRQNHFPLSGIQSMEHIERKNCCSGPKNARDVLMEDLRKSGQRTMQANVRKCILKRDLVDTKAGTYKKKSLDWGNVYIVEFCSNDNLPIALIHRRVGGKQVEAIDAAHPDTCDCGTEGAMAAGWTGVPCEARCECCELDAGKIAAPYYLGYTEETQKKIRQDPFEPSRMRKKICLWQ